MAYLALNAVSAAIFGALNVASFTAVCAGGAHDALPQDTSYPCLLFEVSEQQQMGGLGTRPGQGALPEVQIRLHVFSKHVGMKECQTVMQKAIELLAVAPSVTGYSSWAIFHDSTLPLSDTVIAGEAVRELVSDLRLYVEEAA